LQWCLAALIPYIGVGAALNQQKRHVDKIKAHS
jgi:hypothetical protein